jgi:hypothetical protein
MLRPILIAAALSSLTACSVFEDPPSRQMSFSGQTEWFGRVDLSQKVLQPGQSVEAAEAKLVKWGFEKDDELVGSFSDRISDDLPDDALIYIKYDNSIACRLRRHVIIEHEAGKITDAFGATGEAGCL